MSSIRKRAQKTALSVNRSAAGSGPAPPNKGNGKKRAREADEAEYNDRRPTRRVKHEPASDDEIEIIEDPTRARRPPPASSSRAAHAHLDAAVTGAAVARGKRKGKMVAGPQPPASSPPRRSPEVEEGGVQGGIDSGQEDVFPSVGALSFFPLNHPCL